MILRNIAQNKLELYMETSRGKWCSSYSQNELTERTVILDNSSTGGKQTDMLTAVDNSLTNEFKRSVSSTVTLMIVASDIVRLVRAAQCKTFATFSTTSVSWRQQGKVYVSIQN